MAVSRLLDRGIIGPLYLRRPEIADLVVAAFHDGELKFHRYQLHAYVVMPNHVHLLVTPKVVATRWLAPLKGFTAYRANELLGNHGQPLLAGPSSTAFGLTSKRIRLRRAWSPKPGGIHGRARRAA